MGAWGADTFENDTALDWAAELAAVDDLSFVEDTLYRVLEYDEDYLDADTAAEGLAACDVVARLNGEWGQRDAYTEDVDAWVAAHPIEVSDKLCDRCIAVIGRILADDSELAELWDESEDAEAWREAVADLRSRLA